MNAHNGGKVAVQAMLAVAAGELSFKAEPGRANGFAAPIRARQSAARVIVGLDLTASREAMAKGRLHDVGALLDPSAVDAALPTCFIGRRDA